MSPHEIRKLRSADFQSITSVVDDWWDRPVRGLLPRYFFDHFSNTSFVAEHDGEIVGFLIGFLSPAQGDEAYVHFVGVDPGWRGRGLARALYGRFTALARADGRTLIRAITSPQNRTSIEFHRRLGFELEPAMTYEDGLPVHCGYTASGETRVLMVQRL